MQSRQVVPLRGGERKQAPKFIDIELEAQVLGAVLSDNMLFKDCCFLDGSEFSEPVYGELWSLVSSMIMNGEAATPATIAVKLGPRLEEIGGRDFLSGLTGFGQMIAPAIQDAAEQIRQLSQWRRLNNLGNDILEWSRRQSMSADEAFSALLREAETAIQSGRSTARTKRQVASDAITEAMTNHEPTPTGIDSLDFLMHGGLIRKRMYGLGGFLGRGKTILLGSISDNINARNHRHLVISLETPPEDMEIRNCARHLDLNAAQIFDAGDPLHKRFVVNAQRYVDQLPDNTIYEYMPGATMEDVHRTIIRAAHRFGIEGFILDYWQLIGGRERGQNEREHMRNVANRLAAICRRENIWGLVAAQTDQNGRLEISEWLKVAASLYIALRRDENDSIAHFVTEKSNYTRYADTGNQHIPGMIFDQAGPHFRSAEAADYTVLTHEDATGGDINI